MKASDLMSEPFAILEQDTPVEDIIHQMSRSRTTSLPVVDARQRVIGMVSQRDVFARSYALAGHEQDDALLGLYATDVMNPDVICVEDNQAISDVAWVMVQYNLDIAPVVHQGTLVGIISRGDLIRLIGWAM
ncbi:MAG: CBS domain-containing protein [Anaerolineae bacterium]|nr:CBS domain-containing protein [Anaerolineae bacterium]